MPTSRCPDGERRHAFPLGIGQGPWAAACVCACVPQTHTYTQNRRRHNHANRHPDTAWAKLGPAGEWFKGRGRKRGGRRGEDGEDKLLLPASEDMMCERAVKRKQKWSHACQFPRLPSTPLSLLPPVHPSITCLLPPPYSKWPNT